MSKVPCGGFKLDENFLGMNENDELSLVGGAVKVRRIKVSLPMATEIQSGKIGWRMKVIGWLLTLDKATSL